MGDARRADRPARRRPAARDRGVPGDRRHPPDLAGEPPDLEIYTLWAETVPNPDHAVEIWVNGKKKTIDPITKTVTLKLAELPGETMVAVIKRSGAPDDFEVGKFLLPSKVDIAFQYAGEPPFRRVVRSLPVIAQSYPLFITLVNSPRVRPPARQAARRTPGWPSASTTPRPSSTRAVHARDRQPAAQEARRGRPGRRRLRRLVPARPKAAWKLERMSSQRLGLTLTGDVVFNQKELRYGDLVVRPGPGPDKKWPPQFVLTGRLQFPYEMPGPVPGGDRLGFAVSPRLTGTRSVGALRVDVCQGLQFDAAGILRFLFTSYVNKTLIDDNNQPHRIADQKIAPFLQRLGFTAPEGVSVEMRRAAFVHDPDTRLDWLIVTFRLDPEKAGAKDRPVPPWGGPPREDRPARPAGRKPGPGPRRGDLGPARRRRGEVPGPGGRGLAACTWRRILALDPDPAKWFEGLPPAGEMFFLKTSGNAVAERIMAVVDYSINHAADAAPRPGAGVVAGAAQGR